MIRNKRIRRVVALVLIGLGAVLMLLSPSVELGLVAFAVGILLEILGLALEHHRNSR